MKDTRRRPLVGGNWKMHKVRSEAEAYCSKLLARLDPSPVDPVEVVLFPSAPLLPTVTRALGGGGVVAVGGQDVHPEPSGAFTGDVSAAQLVDAGSTWVLCGHSERRRDHAESDELVGKKVEAAIAGGLTPLLCVGESEEEREANRTFEVLSRQLAAALAGRPEPLAVAYEPVWAIGTGKTATPEIAQEAHAFVRETLADLLGSAAASTKRILYGGSVNPDNAASLYARADIDGFLVGGASLDPEPFSAIIRSCGP